MYSSQYWVKWVHIENIFDGFFIIYFTTYDPARTLQHNDINNGPTMQVRNEKHMGIRNKAPQCYMHFDVEINIKKLPNIISEVIDDVIWCDRKFV